MRALHTLDPMLHPGVAFRFDGTEVTHHTIQTEPTFPYSMPVNEVESTLSQAFNAQTIPTPDQMERIVSDLGNVYQLFPLIEEILGDNDKLKEMAAQSEVHPLGFLKIPLIWEDGKYQLRLNYWRDTSNAAEKNAHNHKFDFASMIILGSMATSLWQLEDVEPPVKYQTLREALEALEVDPNDQEAERSLRIAGERIRAAYEGKFEPGDPKRALVFRADPTKGSDHEAATAEGMDWVQMVEYRVLATKAVYSLLHTARHRATPVSSQLLTLFLRGPNVIERDTIALMSSEEQDAENVDRPKIRLTVSELRGALREIRDKVLDQWLSEQAPIPGEAFAPDFVIRWAFRRECQARRELAATAA